MTLTLISGLLVVYHHLGYPLILRWVQKRQTKKEVNNHNRHYTYTSIDKKLPTITIVIPAYNEQRWIADKIRNLAVLDYSPSRLKVIIACDGCTDKTSIIAQNTANEIECQHLNIIIRNFKINRGKVAVINDVMQDVHSELVVLSDVSALVSVDALLIAAEHFKDPSIGVLNGHYRLLDPGSTGEAAYWRYQSRIKASEAALGSTLGAHGAFYLFRRSLFQPLAPDTINDDFILPMEIVAAGYRAEYENSINALELEKSNDDQDHQRRRRIAAGNCQQLLRLKRLLLPNYGGVSFAFVSGKALRVLMPFLMIIAFIGSLMLSLDYLLFALLATTQLLAYLLASWHLLFRPKQASRLTETLAYLVGGHVAGLVGTLRYLFGLERGRWKRVESNVSQ
jgi:cellulose synthase/poly-beta-1,6-N-acetylglucosamine synthase-like glycosyltransferase